VPIDADEGADHTCDALLSGCRGTGVAYRCMKCNYDVCEPCGKEKAKEAGVENPEEQNLGPPGMRAVTTVWTKEVIIRTGMSCRVKLGDYRLEDFYIDFEDRFHNIQRWEVQAVKRMLEVDKHTAEADGSFEKEEVAVSWYGLYAAIKEEVTDAAFKPGAPPQSKEEIEMSVEKKLKETWPTLPESPDHQEVTIIHKYQMHDGAKIGPWVTSSDRLKKFSEDEGEIGAPDDFWKYGIDFRIGHNAWVVSMLNDKKEVCRYEFKHRIKEVTGVKLHPKDRETEIDRFPELPGSSILAVRWEEVDENKWKTSFIPNETMTLRFLGDHHATDNPDCEHLDMGGIIDGDDNIHGLDDDEPTNGNHS